MKMENNQPVQIFICFTTSYCFYSLPSGFAFHSYAASEVILKYFSVRNYNSASLMH